MDREGSSHWKSLFQVGAPTRLRYRFDSIRQIPSSYETLRLTRWITLCSTRESERPAELSVCSLLRMRTLETRSCIQELTSLSECESCADDLGQSERKLARYSLSRSRLTREQPPFPRIAFSGVVLVLLEDSSI